MTVLLFLAGFFGGIPAGMGMGGGTLLIPILTEFLSLPLKEAALYNLCSFLPTGGIALFFHKKRGLLKTEGIASTVLFALLGSLVGSFLSLFLHEGWLKKGFGVFLIVLALIQLTNRKKSDKIEV